MQHHLHTNLHVLRRFRGMSQQELSDALGIKRSRYNGWESGASEPSIGMLLELRKVLGCPLNILLQHDLRGLLHLDLKQLLPTTNS
jgi:transcriptional regulator with XRE-family HTH domain